MAETYAVKAQRTRAHLRGDHSWCHPARRCEARDAPLEALAWSPPLPTVNRRGAGHLADDIGRKICAGVLPPGSRLPSFYALAGSYEVSLATVRKAMALLRERGLTEGDRGFAVYVADNPIIG